MPPSQQSFFTDEELLARIQMLENGLHHLEAQIPAMKREVEALREILKPNGA